MKKYILILVTIVMYSCCPKDKQKQVPLNLIETWIPYQEGDKIFFSNENNKIDSLEIVSIENTFGKMGHWCVVNTETVEVNIKGSQFTSLKASLRNRSIIFDLEINNKYKLYDYNLDEENPNHVFDMPEFYSKIEIGNSIYDDVLGLKLDSVTVYYGKSIGVVGYRVGDNTFTKD